MSGALSGPCACGGTVVLSADPDEWTPAMAVHVATLRHRRYRLRLELDEERLASPEVLVLPGAMLSPVAGIPTAWLRSARNGRAAA